MHSLRALAPVLVCVAAGFAVFHFFGNASRGYIDTPSLFIWWTAQWNAASELDHAWLVVAVSAWVWWRNGRLPNRERRIANGADDREAPQPGSDGNPAAILKPDPAIVPVAAAALALALHGAGFVAQQTRLSIVAFLLFAWAMLRLAGGKKWSAAAVFPLGFLLFTIPLNVLDSIGFWLRVWVIDASAGLAHVAGIDVLQSGTQLSAPDGRYQYDVVAACSGVRSLTAVAALSLLMGYLSFRAWKRRTLIFLLCFPLVYLGNVARISAIIFAAQLGGQVWGERAHTVMGFGVFAIVLGGVLLGVLALQRWWPESDGGPAHRTTDGGSVGQSGRWAGQSPIWASVAVALLAVCEMVFLHRIAQLPPRGGAGVALAADAVNPVELPAFLGTDWVGRRTEVTAIEREILPPDTGFSRKLYVPISDPAKAVLLSLVLSGRDRSSIHRPELCLVGQGWTIAAVRQHRFEIPDAPTAGFPATILSVRRELSTPRGKVVVPQVVAYWFVSADEIVATHWSRIARDAWNRLRHGRVDRWAYILMQTDAHDGEAGALQRMQTVLRGTQPVFQPTALALK